MTGPVLSKDSDVHADAARETVLGLEGRHAIHIVSASAGSGKTYRLAKELMEAILSGSARPDAVLATTFTNKAAAELQERARQRLLEAGRLEDAHRLAAARIGTIHSVCGRFVADFAFELGLPPDLKTLDERAADRALRRAMSSVVDPTTADELTELATRLAEFPWSDHVIRMVKLLRMSDIDVDSLEACMERSKRELAGLLDEETVEGLEEQLEAALQATLDAVDPTHSTIKTTEYEAIARQILWRLQRGLTLKWQQWYKVATIEPAVKSGAIEEAREAGRVAERHIAHPLLRNDLMRAIELVYGLAKRTLSEYSRYKRTWGVLDFDDQELYCLKLLNRPEIRERLAGQIDLVLVDEFQDTSPVELAIFVRLAEIAKRSVWVGDQKQAIYGFRGTTPELMDACVAAIAGESGPETLPNSYRSRPDLVRLTSDLFAPAFGVHGVDERLVRLEPHRNDEPPGLGPVVEWWSWPGKNVGHDARGVAAGVAALLEDPDVRVRAGAGDDSRPVAPGDVAVLCRTNAAAASVGAALEGIGVRAVLPQAGLLAKPEAQLALAGLQLWVDGHDRVAAATVARLVTYPADGSEWLAAVLAGGENDSPQLSEEAEVVVAARAADPSTGPVAALDRVIQALQLQERCLAWGDAPERLQNLESVRSLAVRYTKEAPASGEGVSVAGLVAYLHELAEAGEDEGAVAHDVDAVVVTTWHQAKGLEWPVTVLFHLDFVRESPPLGISTVDEGGRFDMNAPLAGRWVRYWASPYYAMSSKLAFHERLAAHPETERHRGIVAREQLRLLYVGWTRARDRLVLAARSGKHSMGILQQLADESGALVSTPPAAEAGLSVATWGGATVSVARRDVELRPAAPRVPEASEGYVARGPDPELMPARVPASRIVGLGVAGAAIELGYRLPLVGQPPMDAVGEAVHGFLAADRPERGLGPDERLRLARGLLERWGVAGAMDAADVLTAADRLQRWVGGSWPGAVWHREWPIARRLGKRVGGGDAIGAGPEESGASRSGSVVSGTADLVLDTGAGFILVDHKTFPGGADAAAAKAAGFAGQLAAYAGAIEMATGQPVLATFIHLPVLGLVVPVTPQAQESPSAPAIN